MNTWNRKCKMKVEVTSHQKLITMSKFSFLLTGLMMGGAFAAGLLLTAQPASAQSVFGNSGDSRDPLTRASSGDTGGILQLLQNLQNGQLRDPSAFSREQSQKIDGATSDFKAEQLRRLQAQQPVQPKQK
jgi:hypothetical protein